MFEARAKKWLEVTNMALDAAGYEGTMDNLRKYGSLVGLSVIAKHHCEDSPNTKDGILEFLSSIPGMHNTNAPDDLLDTTVNDLPTASEQLDLCLIPFVLKEIKE